MDRTPHFIMSASVSANYNTFTFPSAVPSNYSTENSSQCSPTQEATSVLSFIVMTSSPSGTGGLYREL